VWFYLSTQREQRELAAGREFTKLQMSQAPNATPRQTADGYQAIAAKYAGTAAAQRAQLQSAAVLFSANDFAAAQPRFESFLALNPNSPLAVQAKMGVAACLEAQGKLDDALKAYRLAASQAPGSPDAVAALFAQGRVLELLGKTAEAVSCYKEVAAAPLAGSLANESAQRLTLLQAKLPAAQPSANPAAKP
jgi:TolA-binding protein